MAVAPAEAGAAEGWAPADYTSPGSPAGAYRQPWLHLLRPRRPPGRRL